MQALMAWISSLPPSAAVFLLSWCLSFVVCKQGIQKFPWTLQMASSSLHLESVLRMQRSKVTHNQPCAVVPYGYKTTESWWDWVMGRRCVLQRDGQGDPGRT